LGRICDLLVKRGLMHEGQKRDVLVRYTVQEKRILFQKRPELRKALGHRRVPYNVSEIEIIAAFRFVMPGTDDERLTEERVTSVVADDVGMPYVLPDPLKLDYKLVTETFPGAFSERHLVIPLLKDSHHIEVAVADPYDRDLIDSIERFTGLQVEAKLAPKTLLMKTLVEYHGFKKSVDHAADMFKGELVDLGNLEQLTRVKKMDEIDASDQPVVQAVWYLFHYAFDQRASDIHIEPKREYSLIRLRIDGVLHRIHMLPKPVHPAVVSRIKSMSRMDIAEKRKPQDGRIKTAYNDAEIELRVSTVPTAFGEKVVIRIFDPTVLLQDIAALGFFPHEQRTFEDFISRTSGLILVTGPTGSGKTTTMYSSLQYLNSPHVNISSIEDPIEMVLEDFNQMAVHPRVGFTFATALRTLLRQDPDIIMVGEIRDKETAEHAVQAALTGHLVLSTLHTNDAATAVSRLLDLGVEPFLLSSVLVGIVAQRLVRTICQECSMDGLLTHDEAATLNIPGAESRRLRVRYGAGCPVCRGTGYRGRTGIFEVMPVDRRVRELIEERSSAVDIKREAMAEGMMTMRECAIKKLARGATTIEEVLRVSQE
jgi:general secretion pathway protein E